MKIYTYAALVAVALSMNGFADPAQAKSARTFSIAVIPDTQYLFDENRGNPLPLKKALEWIRDNTEKYNIVFTVHLGDIVQNQGADELFEASEVFRVLDRARIQYGVLAGNHDVSGVDIERGHSPYLDYFGPNRFSKNPTFCGSTQATDGGYNTCYAFEAGGRKWLLFALDWRTSQQTIDWVKQILSAYPGVPTIIATHELVYDAGGGVAALSPDHGQHLWDGFIREFPQVFLTVNGHFWPSARTVMKNDAGKDVWMNITNYQETYYGGAATIRLYEFDLESDEIVVSTFSPFWLDIPADKTPPLAKGLAVLNDDVNRFTMSIDFDERFADDEADAPLPPVSPNQLLVPGTIAYWRMDNPLGYGAAVPEGGIAVPDLSGNGNDLTRVTLQNGTADDMVWTNQFDPTQPSRGSIFFDGSKSDPSFGGAYLQTAAAAPINTLTFNKGYTIELFFKLPADCCGNKHAWMGALARLGTGGEADKTQGDLDEPVAQLGISPGRELQWAVFPTNRPDMLTNWSHELTQDQWYHLAIVNNGKTTDVFLNNSIILRNPETLNVGLSTIGLPVMVGANHYDNVVEQSFYGWLGDVRIVNRPLPKNKWMTAR